MYLISFIVPLYNKEKCIKKCLASICRQKGKDIQIIVVDDGSTDKSKDIVCELKEKDNRIEYYYQNNEGVSVARNRGIGMAKGEWVVFVDADDFISRDYMEIVRLYLDQQIDCFVMGTRIYKGNTGLHPKVKKSWLCHDWEAGSLDFIYDFLCGKSGALGTSVWNKIFKRKIIEEKNISFLSLKIGEDTRFCMDYAMHSSKWRGIPYYLYAYVQHEESVMHQYNEASINEVNALMNSYDEFGKEYGIYGRLKSAIGCRNVVDIFTVIKIEDRMQPNLWKTYNVYKKLMQAVYYRKKIQWVDAGKLGIRYRVVYYLLKHRMALAMMVLVKVYHLVFKL